MISNFCTSSLASLENNWNYCCWLWIATWGSFWRWKMRDFLVTMRGLKRINVFSCGVNETACLSRHDKLKEKNRQSGSDMDDNYFFGGLYNSNSCSLFFGLLHFFALHEVSFHWMNGHDIRKTEVAVADYLFFTWKSNSFSRFILCFCTLAPFIPFTP